MKGGGSEQVQSLTELYIQLREPVFRFLLRLTGEPDLAEELTQETFLQALLSFSRFRGDATVRTWLLSIARNVYRKRMRHEVGQRRAALDPPPAPMEPPQLAVEREEHAIVARALSALPEATRTALILREYEELSFAEIGAILGRSEVWARVTCFRARQQLRDLYVKEAGGDRP